MSKILDVKSKSSLQRFKFIDFKESGKMHKNFLLSIRDYFKNRADF